MQHIFLQTMALVALAGAPLLSRDANQPPDPGAIVLRECGASERAGHVPSHEDVAVHRRGPIPVIRYPAGTRPETYPALTFRLHVDKSGRVVCYFPNDRFDRPIEWTSKRREALQAVFSAGYEPFERDGIPVESVVHEYVAEEDIPSRHRPMPNVGLDQIRISLQRTGCLGSCPAYRIEIGGEGGVTYTGSGFVDVRGTHRYDVPPSDVAALVEKAREADFWSLRESYRASVTDNPTTIVSITMGNETHTVEDYVGELAGMPRTLRALEEDIDTAARSDAWINLAAGAVEELRESGFVFDSDEGAAILARGTANESVRDDAVLVRLVELGAPIERALPPDEGWGTAQRSLLEEALLLQRAPLVRVLLSRGMLGHPAEPDREELDAAFRSAIRGGNLALVQAIWNFSEVVKPSLVFRSTTDGPEGGASEALDAPVSLLLERRAWVDRPWQGLAIAQWLGDLGCDLNARAANGDTMLHVAADANDAGLVRWLLAKGLDPNALGAYDLPPIGSVQDEDVALLLLEAGSSFSPHFMRYARENHWARVVALIEARGPSPESLR